MRIIIEIEGAEVNMKTPVGASGTIAPSASGAPETTLAVSTAPAEVLAAAARIGAHDAGAAPTGAMQSPGVPPIPGASTAPAQVVAAATPVDAQDAGGAPAGLMQSPGAGAPPGGAGSTDQAAGAAPDIRG